MPGGSLDAGGVHPVDSGESPGPVHDDTDADTLVLGDFNRRNDTVLDGEPLHGSIDNSAIGIGGAGGRRGIERSLADLTHEAGV